jgi:glycosyltransferase involved in cell wall biosynthesis
VALARGEVRADALETRPPLVFIGGMNPRIASGHRSYVQAHALAAERAGFAAHIFYAAGVDEVLAVDYGVVHRVRTRLRHHEVAPVHRRAIADAVSDYLASCGGAGPYVVHGFGVWAASAVMACRQLARRGIDAVPVASAYTTIAHERTAQLRRLRPRDRVVALRYLAWYPWLRFVSARVERQGYRDSRLVLVNYESVRALLARECGSSLRVLRMPYAAPSAFQAVAVGAEREIPAAIRALEPPDGPLIVVVSRHDPRKGLDVLLRALAILRAREIPFRACLVGRGRLLASHRRLAASLRLSGSVAITGDVADVLDYLRPADVFVLPSLEEGSGSVALLEALQSGVAVVATRCDGIPEDLIDGRDALLVAPGDARALADGLERLLADPARRAALAARAVDVFSERFGAAQFIDALRAAYADLGAAPSDLPART